jgi:hypothetical protein
MGTTQTGLYGPWCDVWWCVPVDIKGYAVCVVLCFIARFWGLFSYFYKEAEVNEVTNEMKTKWGKYNVGLWGQGTVPVYVELKGHLRGVFEQPEVQRVYNGSF